MMTHGTWQQTGSGGGKVPGVAALIIVAAVLAGCRNQVAQAAGDAVIVAVAVISAVAILGVTALVLLTRRSRREAEANAAYRQQQAAEWLAGVKEREARALAAQQARALPAPQPIIQVVNVIDPSLLSSLRPGGQQQAVRVIPSSAEDVSR
jgi:hypothetical protein